MDPREELLASKRDDTFVRSIYGTGLVTADGEKAYSTYIPSYCKTSPNLRQKQKQMNDVTEASNGATKYQFDHLGNTSAFQNEPRETKSLLTSQNACIEACKTVFQKLFPKIVIERLLTCILRLITGTC